MPKKKDKAPVLDAIEKLLLMNPEKIIVPKGYSLTYGEIDLGRPKTLKVNGKPIKIEYV